MCLKLLGMKVTPPIENSMGECCQSSHHPHQARLVGSPLWLIQGFIFWFVFSPNHTLFFCPLKLSQHGLSEVQSSIFILCYFILVYFFTLLQMSLIVRAIDISFIHGPDELVLSLYPQWRNPENVRSKDVTPFSNCDYLYSEAKFYNFKYGEFTYMVITCQFLFQSRKQGKILFSTEARFITSTY